MKNENEENARGELALVKPGELMRQATDVAGVCREIVTKTAVPIQGKKYVRVEGWQSIAIAHGCVAGSRDVQRIEGGVKAIGEIRRQDNGAVIATAEGFVGDEEKAWGKRDEYAKRAMAQTRAISRACRSAFAHVVVLMDAGLSTTPAEEVPNDEFPPDDHAISERQESREQQAARTPREQLQSALREVRETMADQNGFTGDWRDARITFGKNKGVQLGELSAKQLGWYAVDWVDKKLADPGRISTEDKGLITALMNYRREAQANTQLLEATAHKDESEVPF